jgi:hypothetical protein
MSKFVIILPLLILLFSCGTILDSSKIIGKWSLTSVEYYVYNPEFDSYKKITGLTSSTPGQNQPINGAFFWSTSTSFTLEFLASNQFYVSDSQVIIINPTTTSWSLNSYENSLTIKVSQTVPGTDNIWNSGFEIKNYWVLASNTIMEIRIDSKDLGIDHINIDVANGTLPVKYMKGIFQRQQ